LIFPNISFIMAVRSVKNLVVCELKMIFQSRAPSKGTVSLAQNGVLCMESLSLITSLAVGFLMFKFI